MSKEIFVLKETKANREDLTFTEYYGGDENGKMIQLTQGFGGKFDGKDEPGYIQLTKEEAKIVGEKLIEWVNKKY